MPSTSGLSGQLFDTIGMEVEGTLQNRAQMQEAVVVKLSKLMAGYFKYVQLDRDASTESMAETFRMGARNFSISTHSRAYRSLSIKGSGNAQVYGYEYKTTPMEVSHLERVLYPLIFTLYENGDVISDRASIHYHVGFANNFRMLKNLLTIMLSLEPVLYRLGGMGGTFRGHLNNAAYCRPLMNSCVVPVSKMSEREVHAHIINPHAALTSKTISDFWAAFGLDYSQSSQNKYHPSRYSGMNFFSLYSHGTAEWRYFNKSFDVSLMIAIGKFMRAVVETSSMLSRRELSRFDIVDSSREISFSDSEEIMGILISLCHEKEVDDIPTDNEVSHILDVLKESHFSPLPETPTNCHIKDFVLSEKLVTKGNLQIVDEFLQTNYVDIHNIDLLSIFS